MVVKKYDDEYQRQATRVMFALFALAVSACIYPSVHGILLWTAPLLVTFSLTVLLLSLRAMKLLGLKDLAMRFTNHYWTIVSIGYNADRSILVKVRICDRQPPDSINIPAFPTGDDGVVEFTIVRLHWQHEIFCRFIEQEATGRRLRFLAYDESQLSQCASASRWSDFVILDPSSVPAD